MLISARNTKFEVDEFWPDVPIGQTDTSVCKQGRNSDRALKISNVIQPHIWSEYVLFILGEITLLLLTNLDKDGTMALYLVLACFVARPSAYERIGILRSNRDALETELGMFETQTVDIV